MSKRSEACEFPPDVRERIKERDGGCIFCNILFKLPPRQMRATDIMHIVPRSQGGLGVEQNGVYGCRWHHDILDNGNKGLRPAMMDYIEKYMGRLYPGWNKENLIYKKEM